MRSALRTTGGPMAETVVSNPRGAEISERSEQLVLPDDGRSTLRVVAQPGPSAMPNGTTRVDGEREFGVSDSEFIAADHARPSAASSDAPSESSSPTRPRGLALPGDRVNRGGGAASPSNPGTAGTMGSATSPPAQRPSFWRRIALGRRASPDPSPLAPPTRAAVNEPPSPTTSRGLAARAREAVAPAASPDPSAVVRAETHALETRIVEPMLQALVSVEAKLERSHSEQMGRADQVEQQLTQLWEIEEQLGTLGELQESLLQVSEQQRRLESAVIGQTRTLRWLIGAVFFSLAAAAFVVAAIR